MHLTNLYEAARQLQHKLDAADVHRQQVTFMLWADGISAMRLEMEYSATGDYGSGYETFTRRLTHEDLADLLADNALDDTLASWITEAHAWVDAIPSAEQRAHDAFTKSLGRLIDQGREIGIEVDFLNPLTNMMQALATNALEDKRNH